MKRLVCTTLRKPDAHRPFNPGVIQVELVEMKAGEVVSKVLVGWLKYFENQARQYQAYTDKHEELTRYDNVLRSETTTFDTKAEAKKAVFDAYMVATANGCT